MTLGNTYGIVPTSTTLIPVILTFADALALLDSAVVRQSAIVLEVLSTCSVLLRSFSIANTILALRVVVDVSEVLV